MHLLTLLRSLWPGLRKRRDPYARVAAHDEQTVRRLRAEGARIGEDCRIYADSLSTEPYLVTIGNGVGISGGVKILTHDGAARLLKGRRPMIQAFGAVAIGDACFIGENALILPGTTIGPGCIIGAGAVVRGTIPANSLVAGNPAKVVGRASTYLERLAASPRALDTFGLPQEQRRALIVREFAAMRAAGDADGGTRGPV